MPVEPLHDAGEVQQRPAQPVHLVDHHAVDRAGLDVGQEPFECGPLHVPAREAAVVVASGMADPALLNAGPLLEAARWTRAISALALQDFSDGKDHRPLLEEIIETLREGLTGSATIGERLLDGRALAIWHKALTERPPAALDITLTGLRVDDGVEPGAAIAWGPASAIAAVPPLFPGSSA